METARSKSTVEWLNAHDLSTEGDASDVAHEVIPHILGAEDLSPADRLELGLGLLDLIEHYWITVELRWFLNGVGDDALWATHWQAFRDHLERPGPTEAVLYSLWVDWFEDIDTVERAFAEVLGNDVPALADGDEALLRRAAAVLKISGPVPWKLKHQVYLTLLDIPRLRPAVFQGVLYSYHDVYGSLEIAPALELLDRLDLPDDTEHLADLRDALNAGHANHHRRGADTPSD